MRVRLGRNVVAGTSTAAIYIGTALISVPLIVDSIGTAAFGVWTIAQSLVFFVAIADGGLGTGLLRFVAVAHGSGRSRDAARVAWTALSIYAVIGVLAAGVCVALAPTLVDLFDIPGDLEGDAEDVFRLVGPIMIAALFGAGLGNLQQGLERFVPFAVSAVVSSVAFLAALVILLPDAGLPGVAWAALIQQGTLAIARAWTVRDALLASRPAVLGGRETRRLVEFSALMQMSALATFANNQSDKVVVGLVAPVKTVGELGIGAQVAEAGRLASATALNPLVSRMSAVHGAGDTAGLEALYLRLERLWTLTVIGATTIGAATLYPLIEGWIGGGHSEAAVLGGFLVVAFGVNLLTGVTTSYLRAVGRPGLEARYGVMVIALNLPITVVLGLLAEARGVVAGTLCAYVLGTAWFFARARHQTPHRPPGWLGSPVKIAAAAVLCAAASMGWGLAAVAVLPTGLALVPVAGGIAVTFVAFMSVTTGVRPTAANARALLA